MAQVLPQGKKKVLSSKNFRKKNNSVRITGFEKDQNFTKPNVFTNYASFQTPHPIV